MEGGTSGGASTASAVAASAGPDSALPDDPSAAASPYLQPCVFWWDSQHLAHCERYLDIYAPFTSMSDDLMALLGRRFIKDMVLRPGDFIEVCAVSNRGTCSLEVWLSLFPHRFFKQGACVCFANGSPTA